jgi:hypothetical protein
VRALLWVRLGFLCMQIPRPALGGTRNLHPTACRGRNSESRASGIRNLHPTVCRGRHSESVSSGIRNLHPTDCRGRHSESVSSGMRNLHPTDCRGRHSESRASGMRNLHPTVKIKEPEVIRLPALCCWCLRFPKAPTVRLPTTSQSPVCPCWQQHCCCKQTHSRCRVRRSACGG